MNQKIIDLEIKRYQLKQRVQYLQDYKQNLEKMVNDIENSRAFAFWQKLLRVKEKTKRLLGFRRKFGTPLSSSQLKEKLKSRFRQHVPYATRIKIKQTLAKFDPNFKEFQSFKKELDLATASISKIELKAIEEKISLIIPTMNAGAEFEVVLKKITSQKAVQPIEVIVIDSGSKDGTVELARAYGAKVIEIPKEEFSHSKARNRAAQLATGKYLIFSVQDAYLMSEYTVYDLVSLLKKARTAAGSGRQIPRADADIFAAWQINEFVNMIAPSQKNTVTSIDKKSFHKLPLEKQRAYCTIDDVLSIYETEVFRSFGGYDERLSYGEDLEMGKRLIEHGYKISFLYTNGVIHSHTRPASYILKRYYTDSQFLYQVFSMTPAVPLGASLDLDKYLSHFLYLGLCLARKVARSDSFSSTKLELLDLDLEDMSVTSLPSELRFTSCQLLHEFLESLRAHPDMKILDSALLHQMKDQLNFFIEYARPFMDKYFNFEKKKSTELKDLMDKIFAVYASNQLAQYALQLPIKNKVREHIDSFLESGV